MVWDLFFLWWKTLSTSWWWYFGGEVEVCANAEQGLIRWSHNRARCQGGPDYHLLLLNIQVVRQWKSGQIKARKYIYANRSTQIQIRKWKLKYKWSRKLPRRTRLPPADAATQLAWSGLVWSGDGLIIQKLWSIIKWKWKLTDDHCCQNQNKTKFEKFIPLFCVTVSLSSV